MARVIHIKGHGRRLRRKDTARRAYCPRCPRHFHPNVEGSSTTPLCDRCWGHFAKKYGAESDHAWYWFGYWAGRGGWGADDASAAYRSGFQRGRAVRARRQEE